MFQKQIATTLVVVSEGLRESGAGSPLTEGPANRDESGHPLYGGIGRYLCHLVNSRLGLRARDEKPGLLARCCMSLASRTDRGEARQLAKDAVRYAVQGGSGGMVSLKRLAQDDYACETELIPFPDIGDGPRLVPDRFLSGEKAQIHKDFLDYLTPLVGGPMPRFQGWSNPCTFEA